LLYAILVFLRQTRPGTSSSHSSCKSLYCIIYACTESPTIEKAVIVVHFKEPSQHLPGGTEETTKGQCGRPGSIPTRVTHMEIVAHKMKLEWLHSSSKNIKYPYVNTFYIYAISLVFLVQPARLCVSVCAPQCRCQTPTIWTVTTSLS